MLLLLPRHIAAGALLLALWSFSTIHAQIMSLEELSSTWIDAQVRGSPSPTESRQYNRD